MKKRTGSIAYKRKRANSSFFIILILAGIRFLCWACACLASEAKPLVSRQAHATMSNWFFNV